jgi:DNA-binding NarL/FixJ family response regulator
MSPTAFPIDRSAVTDGRRPYARPYSSRRPNLDEAMNVLVVDDTAEVRKRLLALLRRIPAVTVVGEADSVKSALEGLASTAVDVVLLDLQLGDGTGLDVLAAVRARHPGVRAIVISNFANGPYRQASLAAGATVFLDKSIEFGRLDEILRGWAEDGRPTIGANDVC